MTPLQWLGWLWCLPVTLAGLLVCLVGGARLVGVRPGFGFCIWIGDRGLVGWFFKTFRMAAFTWGGALCFATLEDARNARTLAHEARHFQQAMWFGLLMPVAYGLCSLWAWAWGGDAYRDSWMERDARKAEELGREP